MIIKLFIDGGTDSDYIEHEINLEYMPSIDDVLYFDSEMYVVTYKEVYFHSRLSEVNTETRISYNLFLEGV